MLKRKKCKSILSECINHIIPITIYLGWWRWRLEIANLWWIKETCPLFCWWGCHICKRNHYILMWSLARYDMSTINLPFLWIELSLILFANISHRSQKNGRIILNIQNFEKTSNAFLNEYQKSNCFLKKKNICQNSSKTGLTPAFNMGTICNKISWQAIIVTTLFDSL